MDFKVGDKVIRNYKYDFGSVSVGTIIKITPKRSDIVVDYGHYKETYDKDGYTKGDVWSTSFIRVLTPEIEKEIDDMRTINKCRNAFKKKSSELTVEQAEKILDILKG